MFVQWEMILLSILNSIALVVGSCANVLMIFSFLLYNIRREASELFLVSLSAADFLICVVYQPLLIYQANNHPATSQLLKSIMAGFGYGLMIASLNGLLAVTLDRFVSIYLPFKYVYWMTERNASRIIAASWVTSLIMAVLGSDTVDVGKPIIHVFTVIILVLLPLLYCVIYREARKQARRIAAQCPAGPFAAPKNRAPTHKSTKGVGVVLMTTVTCWLPVIVFPAFSKPLGMTGKYFTRGHLWCVTAACLNSCMNPFIYYWQFSKFRHAVSKSVHSVWTKVDGMFISNTARQTAAKARNPNNVNNRFVWLVTEENTHTALCHQSVKSQQIYPEHVEEN